MINQVKTAIVEAQEIIDYLPHRAPLVMVDRLYMCSSKIGIAGLRIEYNNIFVSQNEFQESGLVEHMAQTIALKMAFESSLQNKKTFRGFLVVVRRFNVITLPKVGQEVITRGEVVNIPGVSNVANFKSYISGKLIAESQLRLLML